MQFKIVFDFSENQINTVASINDVLYKNTSQ